MHDHWFTISLSTQRLKPTGFKPKEYWVEKTNKCR